MLPSYANRLSINEFCCKPIQLLEAELLGLKTIVEHPNDLSAFNREGDWTKQEFSPIELDAWLRCQALHVDDQIGLVGLAVL